MKKSVSTQQTPANIAAILELLDAVPGALENLSTRLSDESRGQPLGAGERSFTEDVAHLLHCEARSVEAIYLALLADEPFFTHVHPERQLGKLLRYDQVPCLDLLAYFKFRRSVLVRVLASLTEEQWARAIREEGKKRKESVYWRARSLAMHELEHVSDLESKLNR